MSLRVVFMGTPDFAAPTLAEIVGQGHEVVAVYTREPARAGRGMELRPSPVQAMAERFRLPVFTPRSLRTPEALETFAAHDADVAVVVAYGMILPPAILATPREGCLNLHASLLPRWRGAAPIQRAIMAGDRETGIAVMRMEEGLDTGPVGMAERVAITPDMTAGELHDRLMVLGADLMVRALAALSRGALNFVPQPADGVTYARKITSDEGRIDWSRPAREIHDHVRGLSPFPGAWCQWQPTGAPERLRILRTRLEQGEAPAAPGTLLDAGGLIACGEGALRLVQVQRAGKAPMAMDEVLRGARIEPGAVLA